MNCNDSTLPVSGEPKGDLDDYIFSDCEYAVSEK